MEAERVTDLEAFAAIAVPLLSGNEALNCLPLGVLQTARTGKIPVSTMVVLREGAEACAVALISPPYNLMVSALPGDEAIAPLVAAVDALPGVFAATPWSRRVCEAFATKLGRTARLAMHERLYALDRVEQAGNAPGAMRKAALDDLDLCARWAQAFGADLQIPVPSGAAKRMIDGGLLYLWEAGGAPVSMAAAQGPTPNAIRIGYVYTPLELRAQGYATSLVAALSQAQLDAGRRPCLFADLANPTSSAIYQRIGYRPLADVDEWRLV